MEVFINWGEGEDWLHLAKHSHLCRNMKKVTCDILNTLLNLVLFYLYRGMDTELHCCGEGEYWKWFHFRYFSQQFRHNCTELSKSGKFGVVYEYCWTSCYSVRPGQHVLSLSQMQAGSQAHARDKFRNSSMGGQCQYQQRAFSEHHWDTVPVPSLRKHSSSSVFLY